MHKDCVPIKGASATAKSWWNDDASVTPLEARRRLGRYLFETMERFDPSFPPLEWESLSQDDRHFYIDLIAYLLDRRGLVEKALSGAGQLLHSFEGSRT